MQNSTKPPTDREARKRLLAKRLSPRDQQYLRDRGLGDSTIIAANIHTEKDTNKLNELLNYDTTVVPAPAMVIPFHELDGAQNCNVLVKPDRPRNNKKGKPIKFEQPSGVSSRAYFPPNCLDDINDESVDLHITEGPIKALALCEYGFPAIGISGVDGWGKNGELIDDLQAVPWGDRDVYVTFDSDSKPDTRRRVKNATHRLAKALSKAGATVKVIDLPLTTTGEKQGVDDFLVAHRDQGSAEFQRLVDRAVPADGAEVVSLNDIQEMEIEWLHENRIPFGVVSLLDGDPGLGKSLITVYYISRLSKGQSMPKSNERHPPMNCLILSAEDDLQRVIKPRLRASGADLSKVFFLPHIYDVEVGTRPLMLPRDIPHLRSVIRENDIRFIVIDPIMAFLDPKIDTNRDSSVRLALTGIKELAEETGAAFLLVRHLNKRSGGNALYRGGGSIAFTAAVRCNLVVGHHPQGDDRCVFATSKNSFGPKPKALIYQVEKPDDQPAISWLEFSDLGAEDVIDNTQVSRAKRREMCVEQIKKQLTDQGPMPSNKLEQRVRNAVRVEKRTYDTALGKAETTRDKQPGKKDGPWWRKLANQQFPWERKKQVKNAN